VRRLATLALCLSLLPTASRAAPLDLLGFFEGSSVSAGETRTFLVFRDRFTAAFTGRLQDGTLVLDERFRFPEGPRLQRWRLRDEAGTIRGTVETENESGQLAPPVPVTGTRNGDGVRLDYNGIAPGGGRRLGFRHEITPNGDGTLANRVSVRLWGIPVARSRVTFAKSDAALAAHDNPGR
jgi:hypothetical protein